MQLKGKPTPATRAPCHTKAALPWGQAFLTPRNDAIRVLTILLMRVESSASPLETIRSVFRYHTNRSIHMLLRQLV
jgi:hypothetical protein